MKLRTSKLCVNCESIYEGAGPCPDCSSEVFFWVFQALGTALAPKGAFMNGEPGMQRRISSRALPRLADNGGIYADLAGYPAAPKRTFPNMVGRLTQGISRALTSLAAHDQRPKPKAYPRRSPLEFGT